MKRRFENWEKPKFDKRGETKWGWVCRHNENLKLGRCVDVGAFCYLNAKYGIDLGDYVQIGSHSSLYSVSTIDGKKGGIKLKENARLGTHSAVMPGVTIGKNAVIGAFSFVNSDIPDDVLAYGVPARVIRKLTKKKTRKF